MTELTIGQRLSALRARSGLTLHQIALESDYRGRSSVQKYFSERFNPAFLDVEVAQRLGRALIGRGQPSIKASEIAELTGIGDAFSVGAHAISEVNRDVPFYHAKFLEHTKVGSSAVDVAVHLLQRDDPIGYGWHPPHLPRRRQLYGLMLIGGGLSPRYRAGEYVLADSISAAAIGDDVCVYLDREEVVGDHFTFEQVIVAQILDDDGPTITLRNVSGGEAFLLPRTPGVRLHRLVGLHDVMFRDA